MKKLLLFFLLYSYFLKADLQDPSIFLEKGEQEVAKKSLSPFSLHFNPAYFQRRWINPFIRGDLLYWGVKLGGTEYAYRVIGKAMKLNMMNHEKSKQTDFDWDFGIRGMGGLVFPSSGWKFIGQGTWYESKQKAKKGNELVSVLIPFLEILFGSLKEKSPTYSISYKEVLFELKRPFFLSRFIDIETALGMKKLFITQDQEMHFHLPLLSKTAKGKSLGVKDHSYFEALGPLIHLETKLKLFLGLNIKGEIGGEVLFGDFDVKHSEKNDLLQGIDLEAKTHLFASILDLGLGLGWDFYSLNCHLNLTLAYEAHYIWPQEKKIKMEDLLKEGTIPVQGRFELLYSDCDLLFYGMTLRALIEF